MARRAYEKLSGFNDLQQFIEQWRASGSVFEEWASRQLDSCDNLRLELESRCREVAEQEMRIAQQRDEVEFQWRKLQELRELTERGAQQVQAEARRLSQWQSVLAAAPRPAAAWAADSTGSEGASAQATTTLALERELAAAHEQMARLAGASAELAQARGELLAAKSEIVRLRERLAREKGHFSPNLRQQYEFLESERQRLIAELQAAQSQLSQRHDAETAAWLDELKSMRQTIEQLSEALRRQRDRRPNARRAPAQGADPNATLEGLIEQFDRLTTQLQSVGGAQDTGPA
jgi:chromosome segregation ATPase